MQTRRRDDQKLAVILSFLLNRSRIRTEVLHDARYYTCAITDTPRSHALIYLFLLLS